MRTFHVEIVKPSHYDRQGYVIQWWKACVPSNSMACLYAIAQDCADNKILGDDVEIEVRAHDEIATRLPIDDIAARITANGDSGVVCLVGVQSNQFPRAMAIAKQFRSMGVPVAIGGFHVSGVISMLKEPVLGLQEALDMGITLFAGEAEEHFGGFLRDIDQGAAKPIYNYMDDLPGLEGKTVPVLPKQLIEKYDGILTSFDAGRGCPFQCSFCTIINVQGRKSRWRGADDIERIVRENAAEGIAHYFVTDDNFARNKNWEAIFDRLIELKENEGLEISFLIQVDVLAHQIEGFIEKAARAGCKFAFVGLESINPDNLVEMNKGQNRITEYRQMFQAWKQAGIITYAGFIMGLPGDTPETIRRDIEIIQRELPVDLLEFTMLTPLPGSADHKRLYDAGTWMDPDLNKYDLENVTVEHPKMSAAEWQQAYHDSWRWYYSAEHIATMMKRNQAYGIKPVRVWRGIMQIYNAMEFEEVHPQQCGYFRIKDRKQRRPDLPRESVLRFYSWFLWSSIRKYLRLAEFIWRTHRIRRRVQKALAGEEYTDLAIRPVVDAENEDLEMFSLNDRSRAAVEKARRQAEAREKCQAKQRAATG